MKKIILLFISIISIIECFAQTDSSRSQIFIKYSNSYSKGNHFHYIEGENIDFTSDSNENYRVISYQQATKPFEFKIKRGEAFAFNAGHQPNTNISNLIPVSKIVIEELTLSINENIYEKQNILLKEHFKTLKVEDIINIAKRTPQFKEFRSENDLKLKIGLYLTQIKDLSDLVTCK